MSAADQVLRAYDAWYSNLKVYPASGGPARGTVCAALVVLERLKENCRLDPEAHRAAGGSEIQGASGSGCAQILARLGETRPFLSEGGRTNRGGPGDIDSMLATLRTSNLCEVEITARLGILDTLQRYLGSKVAEWHSRQRLSFSFDIAKSAWQIVHEILGKAREAGKEGPIAQYLMGAKLQLRYPKLT